MADTGMDLNTLLAELQQRGVRLELEGDQLRLQAPRGVMNAELQAALRRHKPALIEHLREPANVSEGLRRLSQSRYPLASVQKRLWFLQQLEPGSTRYHEAAALRLNGQPDPERLKAVLAVWASRHEILRTSFHYDGGELYQQAQAVIVPELRLGLAEDVPGFVNQPFDLTLAPLFRVGLFTETYGSTLLVLVFHHLITDFWSAGLALQELNELWSGSELPPPPLQYGDYAYWQSQQPVNADDLAYWQELLQDKPLALDLGGHKPDSQGQPAISAGGLAEIRLSEDLIERWRSVSASAQVTRFVWLVSAWQLYLCRWYRLESGVMAFPSVGRPHRELENLPGCFVNTQLMPFDYEPQLSFSQLTAQTQTRLLGMLDHAGLPFEALVEVLKPPRDLPYFPQLGVVMQDSWQSDSTSGLRLGEYSAEWVELDLAPKFELLLSWLGFRGALRLSWDAGLHQPERMQALLEQFSVFFEATLRHPSRPVIELPLISPAAAAALRQRWRPQAPVFRGWLHQFVEQSARQQPERPALRWQHQTLTYGELNARANRWARVLQQQGVSAGDRVAVKLAVSPELIIALLAILKAGAAYVPIDEDCPPERQAAMLEDCQPQLLIAEQALSDVCALLSPVSLDESAKDQPEGNLNLALAPETLAYIIYTSGSTGRPNGVCISHACAGRLFTAIEPAFATAETDIWLLFHSVAFDYSVWEIWGCFFSAGALVLSGREQVRDPAATWRTVLEQGVTVLSLTPSAFRYLSREAVLSGQTGQLQKILISGEKLELPWLQDWFQNFHDSVQVYTSYGITETTVFVTWRRLYARELSLGRPVIGWPLADLGLSVLDEQLRPVPDGVMGELCVLGAGLASGYWQRPELTAQRYVQDPETGERLYRSGDLVRVDSDGEIVYLGRRDLQIKLRGYRIEAGEIQNALETLDGVSAAHAALRDTPAGPMLLAWVQPASLDPRALRAQLASRLPGPMLPSRIIPLATFPLNQNGKTDTRALPLEAPAKDALADLSVFDRLSPGLEAELGSVLAKLLGRSRIGPDENFFELGGHSLLMVEAREQIQTLTGISLELVDLFQYPTLRQLAGRLKGISPISQSKATRPFRPNPLSHSEPIAIIGMALRLPGADSPEAFWDLLSQGRESVRRWTEAELSAVGVSELAFRHPDYVPASAWCEGIEDFDAAFFGYSPREAELLDPQQRLMLSLAWEALDRAGYGDHRRPQPIGVFASTGISRYLMFHLSRQPLLETMNPMQILIANDKDFLATRVSHKLNLTGPSLMVQSACSSSLAAVHLACESLRSGECETALAGGVSLDTLPQGYRWLEGAIYSRDGHCRPFDAEATGIIGGSGGAWVVLKPLTAALADGDTIYASIQSTALNNDGADKAGFLAPSVSGQRRVIESALELANLSPAQIGVVEAHGTGTPIGDPIELRALRQAWGWDLPERALPPKSCAIGSLKSNLGHLDAAAGVASLIKTALMLHHGAIVPTLNVTRPNPQLQLDSSPFYLPDRTLAWTGPQRYAAVSSLGIGGTNVHALLAAAPERQLAEPLGPESVSQPVLLPLTATSAEGLKQLGAKIATSLRENTRLTDLAYTLQQGRQPLAWRAYLTADNLDEVRAGLNSLNPVHAPEAPPLVFLCPGLGSQQPGMGRAPAQLLPAYSEALARCQSILSDLGWSDSLLELLTTETDSARLAQPERMQPLIFCHGYALATGLIALGIKPAALVGHSFGEYLAVTLAGMAPLEDMLGLVLTRARLFARLPVSGGVLSVAASLEQVGPWLSNKIVLAAVNGPDRLTLSGERSALSLFLTQSALPGRWLDIPHAVHHGDLDSHLPELSKAAAVVRWRQPSLPVISGLKGRWHNQAPAPEDWAQQARQTIQFYPGLEQLRQHEILGQGLGLELGAGKTLAALLRPQGIQALAGPKDLQSLLEMLGELWNHGLTPSGFGLSQSGRRIALPPTPLQPRRHWIPARPPERNDSPENLRRPLNEWFELPLWRQARLTAVADRQAVLVLPENLSDWPDILPERLLCKWPHLSGESETTYREALSAFARQRDVVKALISRGWRGSLIWLSEPSSDVSGRETLSPWPALLMGLIRSLPYEAPEIRARWIESDDPDQVPEAEWSQSEPHVAWRDGRRWLPALAPAGETGPSLLRPKGVYVITGASGGMGQIIADWLQASYGAQLVLISRQTLPDQPGTLPLAVDVSQPLQLKAALETGRNFFGRIDGVFHCAGIPGGHVITQLDDKTLDETLKAKILGSLNLSRALSELEIRPDFVLLASSLASLLGSPGQSAYAAANAWLDAWARQQGDPWISVNWGTWREGMAARALEHLPAAWRPLYQNFLTLGIDRQEGLQAIDRVLGYNWPQISVTPVAVSKLECLQSDALLAALSRPSLAPAAGDYTVTSEDPPIGELENRIAAVWHRCLGVSPSRQDRFGALGGDSLMVVQMKSLLEQELGQELPLGLFLEDKHLAELAAGINGEAKPSEELLLKLNGAETGQPVFFVHAISGTIFPFRDLASALAVPFYGLQSRGLISPRPHADLVAMARDYRQLIEARFAPPYRIGGWSFGGLVAWEMARQWLSEGIAVSELILLDMQAPVPGQITDIDDQGLRERFEADLNGLGPLALAEEMKERLWRIFEAHVLATRDFHPQQTVAELSPPNTLLLVAEKGFGATHTQPDLGWGPWLGQPQIVRIPGDHYSCLEADNLASWVTRLNGTMS